MNLLERLKRLITERILGLSDTPGRIAWGVFIGTVIAWTPTIGFQIMLYVAFATVLRANKVSGIPVLFISNPVSAVPLYWFCWKVGAAVLGSNTEAFDLEARLAGAETEAAETDLWTDIWTSEFWDNLLDVLVDMGLEMWTGSLILGVSMAVPSYFLTLWAVRAYRRGRGLG